MIDIVILIANALTIFFWVNQLRIIGLRKHKLFNYLVGAFFVSGSAIVISFTKPALVAVGIVLQLVGIVLASIQYYFFNKHKKINGESECTHHD